MLIWPPPICRWRTYQAAREPGVAAQVWPLPQPEAPLEHQRSKCRHQSVSNTDGGQRGNGAKETVFVIYIFAAPRDLLFKKSRAAKTFKGNPAIFLLFLPISCQSLGNFLRTFGFFCRICTFRILNKFAFSALIGQCRRPWKSKWKKGWNKTGEMLYFVCCV